MRDKLSENCDVSSAVQESAEYRDPAALIRLVAAYPHLNGKARKWQ